MIEEITCLRAEHPNQSWQRQTPPVAPGILSAASAQMSQDTHDWSAR
ncbi:MAG TPA: hypothetical protein VJB69_02110 [Candidatus Paceibacterota bacterium]